MFSSSAPYVVTILVSVITWALSAYHDSLSTTPFLKYELVKEARQEPKPYLVYRFTNLSPLARIRGFSVAIDCPTTAACFTKQNEVFGELLKVPPWGIMEKPELSATQILQPVDLPPNMAFEMKANLKNPDTKPFVYFSINNSPSHIVFVGSQTFDIFIARNFLSIVFSFWFLALICIIFIYVLIVRRARKTKNEPQVFHVKLLEGSDG